MNAGRTRWHRHGVVAAILVAGAVAAWWVAGARESRHASTAGSAELVVYRSPACTCCRAWAEYMEESGFTVRVVDRSYVVKLKYDLDVPTNVFSCHTSVIEGYVVEGHVPASTVRRYLAAGAPGEGVAVPGMPAGSPGMPGPQPASFDVFTFEADGRTAVFESW